MIVVGEEHQQRRKGGSGDYFQAAFRGIRNVSGEVWDFVCEERQRFFSYHCFLFTHRKHQYCLFVDIGIFVLPINDN